jgi:hypothetical protein
VPAHGTGSSHKPATLRPAKRATLSRGGREAQVGLSFSDGLEIDRNTSRRLLQRLRQSLRWEEAPVITGFDPRFNQSQPLWCAPRRRAPAQSPPLNLLEPPVCALRMCSCGNQLLPYQLLC